MQNNFYNMMFNQHYINQTYFNSIQPLSQKQIQDEKVYKAVRAVRDLCEAVNGMDDEHQQEAFYACLAEMALQFGWR